MKKAGVIAGFMVAIALLGCVGSMALGQSADGGTRADAAVKAPIVPRYYHLAFVVKELENGKVTNSREYAISVKTVEYKEANNYARSIRTGTKVPFESESNKLNYVDVGVNIDCRDIVDLGGRLGMNVSAEISNVQRAAADEHARMETTLQHAAPMIQQNRWVSDVVVVLGKPTVLFSSDDVTSKRTLELELTATEIK